MNPNTQLIINACEAAFIIKANQDACNYFVIAVVLQVKKITLVGQADDIINNLLNLSKLPGNTWTALTRGDFNSAKNLADNGWLVIGGLMSTDFQQQPQNDGHVLVVVSNPDPQVSYKSPTAYWGSLNGIGSYRANPLGFNPPVAFVNYSSIDWSFLGPDLPNIRFFATQI